MKMLTGKHLSFVCPMNFSDMPESANGRYCDQCQKEVMDLTDCSIDEAIALQKKHGSVCAVVRTTAVVATAAAAMSLASCKTTELDLLPPHRVGKICPVEYLEDAKK